MYVRILMRLVRFLIRHVRILMRFEWFVIRWVRILMRFVRFLMRYKSLSICNTNNVEMTVQIGSNLVHSRLLDNPEVDKCY